MQKAQAAAHRRPRCCAVASCAFAGGNSPAANALYLSVMGDDHTLYEPWVKEWR